MFWSRIPTSRTECAVSFKEAFLGVGFVHVKWIESVVFSFTVKKGATCKAEVTSHMYFLDGSWGLGVRVPVLAARLGEEGRGWLHFCLGLKYFQKGPP